MIRRLSVAAVASLLLVASPACAGTTRVAVAANFTEAAREIARAFSASTGHEAVLSFGSSGQFYTQIRQAAPFQVFLSADDERPKALAEEGLAVADSRFTYAVGKLVLWSKDAQRVTGEQTLRASAFGKLSIANPAAAPYGGAAIEVLKSLDLYETLRPRIVMGNSIAQAFQFIETGNAEIGFVALSQLAGKSEGSRWLVPQARYTPIRQDAILLTQAASDEASNAFLEFLKGPEAKAVIERLGYAAGS